MGIVTDSMLGRKYSTALFLPYGDRKKRAANTQELKRAMREAMTRTGKKRGNPTTRAMQPTGTAIVATGRMHTAPATAAYLRGIGQAGRKCVLCVGLGQSPTIRDRDYFRSVDLMALARVPSRVHHGWKSGAFFNRRAMELLLLVAAVAFLLVEDDWKRHSQGLFDLVECRVALLVNHLQARRDGLELGS